MDQEKQLVKEVENFFHSYVETTGKFHKPIVQTDWFTVPSMIDSSALPGRAKSVGPEIFTSAAALAEFRAALEAAYKDIDLARADCQVLGVWPLSDNAVLLLAAARRFRQDGSQFPQTRHLYLITQGEEGWRIFANVAVNRPFLGPGNFPRDD